MGEFYASVFNRKIDILVMSIQLSKRPNQDLKDLAYVKIGPVVLVNTPYVPDQIRQAINTCDKITKPLIQKTFDNLARFQFTIVIVVVPVRFSFTLSADMGIDLVYTICPSKLTLNVGVEPWFTLSVRADAGITIAIATGGVSVTASFNYRLKPNVGTANCNICAIISQTINPITIQVDAFAEALFKRWTFQIYKWAGPSINQELFRKCLKDGAYNPSVSTPPKPEVVQPAQPKPEVVQPVQPKPEVVQPVQPVFVQPTGQQQTCGSSSFNQEQYAYAQWLYQQQLYQWYQLQQPQGCTSGCK